MSMKSKIFWKFYVTFLLVIFLSLSVCFFLKSSFTSNLAYGFFTLLVALFVSALASLIMAYHFAKPLREMIGAVQALAQHNFKVRVRRSGRDEVALLAKSFNELALIFGDWVHKLSDEKKQLKVTLDSMVEGVIVLDREGEIVLSNPAFRAMFNLKHPPEGSTPIELFRNADLQQIVEGVVSGKECLNSEIQMQKEGLQYFMVHGTPFTTQQGVEGSVIVFHDITSLRKLESVRRDFVANVSHELKTPLTAIKGYAETLLRGALQDEENAPKFVKIIDEHANRLNRIVQDLLDLSKIESNYYELQLENFKLAPFLDEVQATFEKSLATKNLDFQILNPSVEFVWADPGALRQVLNNLIDNAIKYSQAGAKVELKLEFQKGQLLFCVKDSGSGIPPEHLTRIFERFYRVDISRSRQQGGTGLGLSIVKHLVQLHGGKIWAESEIGKGSAFYFTLPQENLI